jgi:hypothetical protein
VRYVIKIEHTTYEVDNPRTAAALKQCKSEEAANAVMERAAEQFLENGRRVGE